MAKILPASMMPYTPDGDRADIVLNCTGVMPRSNLGQIIELVMQAIGIAKNEVQIIEPFSEMDIEKILEEAKQYGLVEKPYYNGFTGRLSDKKMFIGNMLFYRSEHECDLLMIREHK